MCVHWSLWLAQFSVVLFTFFILFAWFKCVCLFRGIQRLELWTILHQTQFISGCAARLNFIHLRTSSFDCLLMRLNLTLRICTLSWNNTQATLISMWVQSSTSNVLRTIRTPAHLHHKSIQGCRTKWRKRDISLLGNPWRPIISATCCYVRRHHLKSVGNKSRSKPSLCSFVCNAISEFAVTPDMNEKSSAKFSRSFFNIDEAYQTILVGDEKVRSETSDYRRHSKY